MRILVRVLHLAVLLVVLMPAGAKVSMGAEYCFLGTGKTLRETGGCDAAKLYPGMYPWREMQPSPDAPIDFTITDHFVSEFQEAGIQRLLMTIKTWDHGSGEKGNWGVRGSDDHRPKPEYEPAFQEWVRAMVERYDGDGVEDMPGLIWPVREWEVGEEFSTYEPESGEEYVEMLRMAYHAAHNASSDVVILHSAFFIPEVFKEGMDPLQYEGAYNEQRRVFESHGQPTVLNHDYSELLAILDAGDVFDALNIHSLMYPSELYGLTEWLQHESMVRQSNKTLRYPKEVVVSDTAITPFIALGSATSCTAFNKGYVFPPAREEDRCRLAQYFTDLLDKDKESLEWVYDFCAADVVKRLAMAAHTNISLINMAFTEDLYNPFLNPFTSWLMGAGAGNSIWSGMMETSVKFLSPVQERTVKAVRPPLLAMQRLNSLWFSYRTVRRNTQPASSGEIVRYTFDVAGGVLHVIWLEPLPIVLPGEPQPVEEYAVPAEEGASVELYSMYCKECREMGLASNVGDVHTVSASGSIAVNATIHIQYLMVQT